MSEKKSFWEKVKEQGKTQVLLTYVYGGEYNKSKDVNVYINEDKLFYGVYSIPLRNIQSISMKQEEQVAEHMKSRITATRLLLLGPFALAAPKRKFEKHVSAIKYLVIDYIDNGTKSSIVFSGDNCNKMMNTIKSYLPNSQIDEKVDALSNQQSKDINPYEEIKKVKELLDMGIISQEEFEKKKKKLLDL